MGQMVLKIKPLNWGSSHDNGSCARLSAYGVGRLLIFQVESFDEGRRQWRWHYGTDGDFNYFPDQSIYASPAEATAAAEAWHSAMVLASFEEYD